MLSISGSNSRKSVADWTLVNIHYFYKDGWIRESYSDSLLVSLILSEKPPRNLQEGLIPSGKVYLTQNVLRYIYGFS